MSEWASVQSPEALVVYKAIAADLAKLLHTLPALRRKLFWRSLRKERKPYFKWNMLGVDKFYEDHPLGKLAAITKSIKDGYLPHTWPPYRKYRRELLNDMMEDARCEAWMILLAKASERHPIPFSATVNVTA